MSQALDERSDALVLDVLVVGAGQGRFSDRILSAADRCSVPVVRWKHSRRRFVAASLRFAGALQAHGCIARSQAETICRLGRNVDPKDPPRTTARTQGARVVHGGADTITRGHRPSSSGDCEHRQSSSCAVVVMAAAGAGGFSHETTTALASSAAMIPSDHSIGNLPPNASFSHTIFSPTKIRITASAYLSRWKRSTASASRKYIARRPRMANTLDVKTIERLARDREDRRHRVDGEDDVAHLEEQQRHQQRRGVPAVRRRRTKNRWPCRSGVTGIQRRNSRISGLRSGSTCCSGVRSIFMPVAIRNAPKIGDDQPVLHQHRAQRDEDRPEHQRAEDPVEQHAVLILRRDAEVAKTRTKTKMLSTASDFSTR